MLTLFLILALIGAVLNTALVIADLIIRRQAVVVCAFLFILGTCSATVCLLVLKVPPEVVRAVFSQKYKELSQTADSQDAQ